jgi:hypothetical protein
MFLEIPELYDCIVAPTFIEKHFILVSCAGFFMVGALVVLLYRAYTRYKESRKPCWDLALNKIARLSLVHGASQGLLKLFYADLTRILKWYCHKRYNLVFVDKTDDELLESLKLFDCSAESLDKLQGLVHLAVQIKFAKEVVSVEQAESDKQIVINFIRSSISTET